MLLWYDGVFSGWSIGLWLLGLLVVVAGARRTSRGAGAATERLVGDLAEPETGVSGLVSPRGRISIALRALAHRAFVRGVILGAGVVMVASTPTVYARNVFVVVIAIAGFVLSLWALRRLSAGAGLSDWVVDRWYELPDGIRTALVMGAFLAFIMWLAS